MSALGVILGIVLIIIILFLGYYLYRTVDKQFTD